MYGFNSSTGSQAGYVAEVWHAGTLNIDAARNNSSVRATVPDRYGGNMGFAQPDIETSWGDSYGLKYYKPAYETAKQQAKTYWERYCHDYNGTDKSFESFLQERGLDPETVNKYESIYNGQMRLVPSDQLEEIIDILKKKIGKDSYLGKDISSYQETLSHLTDRLKSPDGMESIPLSKNDADILSRLARDGEVDLKKIGISTDNLIKYEHILKQAVNAGMSAAVISMVLQLAPEIYKTIGKLMKEGHLCVEDLKNLGFTAIEGGSKGFLKGSVSAAVTSACLSGKLGMAMKSVDPMLVGTITVVIMNTISYSLKLASNEMTKEDFALAVSKDLFLSFFSVGFGTVTQALLPQFAAFAFLLGSCLGSVAGAFVYDKGYNAFMSFCCDTGFTCFGLVTQDYKIPDEILKAMNIKTFDFKSFEFKSFEFKTFAFKTFDFKTFEYETFGMKLMSRDVIGLFKVGYTVK